MFQSARVKLTLWYLLIIMLVSITFSVGIYGILSREINRFERIQRFRIERKLREGGIFNPMPPPNPELLEETKRRIIFLLVLINGAILVVSGGFGYILAGKTLQPIKEMVDEQNRFISDASHELRTPLTSLKTTMEVSLRDKNLTLEDAKKLILESVVEVNKLQSLSEELLQVAQYEKPDLHSKFATVSLDQVIRDAIHKITPLAKQKEIVIKFEDKKIELVGEKYSLTDLVVILLDNAVKYSHNRSKVIVNTEKTDGFVLISVQDHGIGIDEKDSPHIFDRFYRADLARLKTSSGGYGLGLSIAKKIVEIHHGTITVENKLKKGSTFTARLPVR